MARLRCMVAEVPRWLAVLLVTAIPRAQTLNPRFRSLSWNKWCRRVPIVSKLRPPAWWL